MVAKNKYWDGLKWEEVGASASKITLIDNENIINATDVEGAITELKQDASRQLAEIKDYLKTEKWDVSYDSGIVITHNLNYFPIAIVVGKNTFGHAGYGILPVDAQYQVFNMLEYIDINTIRLYLSEEYIGIPTIIKVPVAEFGVDENEYGISFDSDEEDLRVYLR